MARHNFSFLLPKDLFSGKKENNQQAKTNNLYLIKFVPVYLLL